MKNLRGKKALVSGAASGIGRAIALALAREGTDVCLFDIDEAGLAKTAEQVRSAGVEAVGLTCDLGQPSEITACLGEILRRWGRIEILVNNAGIAYYGPTDRMTAEQWDRLISINLLAPIRLTSELLKVMLAQPQAHILNVSSIFGLVPARKMTAYQVGKFGLVGFSEALRLEYTGSGLSATVLCPGFVRTGLFDATINASSTKAIRTPPAWLSTTPEIVAERAVRAIKRNQRLVVVTPLAKLLWFSWRLFPDFLDVLVRFGWKRKRKSVDQHKSTETFELETETRPTGDDPSRRRVA